MAVANTESKYQTLTLDGGNLTVRLSDTLIDRMNVEIMRGYGATKRRGAETGGLLIGSITRRSGAPPVVAIEDYETIACEYCFGPSWNLSEEEEQRFADIVAKWQPGADKPTYAVGFFRSHTRPGLAPDDYDSGLFERHFGQSQGVLLLIKPYGTRNAVANFFASRDGKLRPRSDAADFEFAVTGKKSRNGTAPADSAASAKPPAAAERRTSAVAAKSARNADRPEQSKSETGPGNAAADASASFVAPPAVPSAANDNVKTAALPVAAPVFAPAQSISSPVIQPAPMLPVRSSEADRLLADVIGPRELPARTSPGSTWNGPQFGHYSTESPSRIRPVLLQIAFTAVVFAFGALAGYQYAGGQVADLAPGRALPVREPYSMNLTANRRADAIAIEWNRNSQPIHHARNGTLIVTEGAASKVISLSPLELRNGLVLYRTTAEQVEFKLEVTVREKGAVAETVTWRRGG